MNGRVFKLAKASSIAAMRQSPPGAPYPDHFDNIASKFALKVGCDATAANEAAAATMLAICAIVTMPNKSEI